MLEIAAKPQHRDKCKFDCVYHLILNLEIQVRAWNLYLLYENVLHVNNKNNQVFPYCVGFRGFSEILPDYAALMELCGPAPAHPVRRPVFISNKIMTVNFLLCFAGKLQREILEKLLLLNCSIMGIN